MQVVIAALNMKQRCCNTRRMGFSEDVNKALSQKDNWMAAYVASKPLCNIHYHQVSDVQVIHVMYKSVYKPIPSEMLLHFYYLPQRMQHPCRTIRDFDSGLFLFMLKMFCLFFIFTWYSKRFWMMNWFTCTVVMISTTQNAFNAVASTSVFSFFQYLVILWFSLIEKLFFLIPKCVHCCAWKHSLSMLMFSLNSEMSKSFFLLKNKRKFCSCCLTLYWRWQ